MSYQITMYTDGAAKGNPGPGGYGTVLIAGAHRKELFEGFALTTNNRMELLAVIAGLEALKFDNCHITVYSDSKYVVDAVEKKWVYGWKNKLFKGKKNKDLWLRYLEAAKKHHIKFVWVKGHAGNPLNEYCDRLAVMASAQAILKEDTWYVMNKDLEND